ncbi:NTP transferase domain-containing protein, partial [Candidatus Methanarcanum hacksteinii]|uniref:NTP transferase domain-containing protein n=1 Tax=Candidatus Methanarcanum hacksteinii TaxID=2911857 RepID=UPI0037DC5E3C
MEALIMAGGKGTRLCKNGVEKPYINVAGKHVIEHVINALKKAKCVDRILVTVSPNTKKTEEFLIISTSSSVI